MSVIKLAIVGAGVIAMTHARAAAGNESLTVSCLIDSEEAAATALADLIEAEGAARPAVFSTLEIALRENDIDLVAICVPSGLHVNLAEIAIAAGKHVLVEKPLDVSLARARALLHVETAARAHGRVISVVSQHRFDPGAQLVHRAITSGDFGALTSAVCSVSWWRSQDYYDSAAWRGTWAMDGGGAMMNQGVHTVDLLLWFMGRPLNIQARTALTSHSGIEVEDLAVATFSFESGSIGVLHATTAAYPGLGTMLQIMGDAGSAVIRDDELDYFYRMKPGEGPHPMGLPSSVNQVQGKTASEHVDPTESSAGHARQYADVVHAIQHGGEVAMSVYDAFLCLAAVHGSYVSAQLGISVDFDKVIRGDYDDFEMRGPVGRSR